MEASDSLSSLTVSVTSVSKLSYCIIIISSCSSSLVVVLVDFQARNGFSFHLSCAFVQGVVERCVDRMHSIDVLSFVLGHGWFVT